MTGIIVSTPPLVEQPPGSNSSNPSSLPAVTYQFAILSVAQTWTAKQTFPLGNISLFAADVIGLTTGFAALDQTNTFTAGPQTISPPVNSNTQGLVINQTLPLATTSVGPYAANQITITDNGYQTTTAGIDQYGLFNDLVVGQRLNYIVNGPGSNTIRLGFAATAVITTTAPSQQIQGSLSSAAINVDSGGTSAIWGSASYTYVGPLANISFANAIEITSEIRTGAVVTNRVGAAIASVGDQAAVGIDAAITVGTGLGAGGGGVVTPVPFKDAINLWMPSTFPPLTTSGSVINTSGTFTIANFANLPNVTISGNILNFPNVVMSGSGFLRLSNVINAAALSVTGNAAGSGLPSAFQVDTSNGQGNGVYVFSTAAGSGANITTISTTTNEALKINARGSGTIDLGGTSTGGVTIHGSFTATGLVTSAALNADVFSTAHSWAGQQTFVAPILGTPASGVATNLTGTAASLTAGHVTTNANMTGDVTSVGNATTLAAGNAGNLNSGTLLAARMPALTGDITTSAGAVATTLATVNSNVGSFGSTTTIPVVTVNAKGLVTAVTTAAVTSGRTTLSGATTYYARTDGNDSNTGLVDSAGGGFLTIAKAMSVAGALDCGAFQLTIQIDAGTWTTPIVLPRTLGALSPILTGVGSTTIISTTSASCVTSNGATPWVVQNMKLQTTTAGIGLNVTNGGSITFSGIEFGAIANYGIFVGTGSVTASGAYTITGSAQYHIIANGSTVFINGVATLTGTPAFSGAYALANRVGAIVYGGGSQPTGAATGVRYSATLNGVIDTAGGGATYLPGGTVGSTATGGQYN